MANAHKAWEHCRQSQPLGPAARSEPLRIVLPAYAAPAQPLPGCSTVSRGKAQLQGYSAQSAQIQMKDCQQ